MTPRFVHLSLSADGSLLREEILNGVKYLVCPVISKLGDNVEWPINAPTPELIPASVLSLAVSNRNNRPVVMGHPQDENGNYISANEPGVLEKYAYGFMFAAKFEDNKVSCEMWLDPIRAEKVPLASRVIERLQAGEMVEVSEGNYVLSEIEEGEWQGKAYGAKWIACWSDHLATLSEGQLGACSIDDGCGANRVSMGLKAASVLTNIRVSALTQARRPTFTGTETSTWAKPIFADYVKYLYNGDDPPTSVGKCTIEMKREIAAHTLLGDPDANNFADLTSHAVVNPASGYLNENALRSFLNDDNSSVKEMVKRLLNSEFSANLPDKKVEAASMDKKKSNPLKRMLDSMAIALKSAMSNNDLRWKLYKAIEKIDPAISFVSDEDVATGEVFYCTIVRLGGDYWEDGEREYHNYKRTFTIDEKENVTVNDDAIEIEWFSGWKPIGEATPRSDTTTSISAASSACGCNKGENTMAFDRKVVINRLSSLTSGPFTENLKALEAMDDKGLEELDKAFPDKVDEKKETPVPVEPNSQPTPAPTPPVDTKDSVSLSREEYTKMLAASNAFDAQQAALKASLVSNLKAAQSEFTEVDLNAMEVPQLERLARVLKVNQSSVSSGSYVGLPIPKDVAKPVMRDLPDPLGLKVHGLRPDGREFKEAN